MKLESLAETLWRQRVVVASVLLIGLVCFGFALTRGKKYSATSTILAGSVSTNNTATLDPTKNPIENAISPLDLPALLHSSTVVGRVGSALHLSPEHTAKLATSVNAKANPAGNAMPITATDTDPQLAVGEANAFAHELQRFEQQIAESRYDLLIQDLRGQLAQERSMLGDVDTKIAGLTSADPFISDKDGTAALNARLVALQTQRDTIQTQMLGDSAAMMKAAERPTLTRDLASKEIVQNDPVFQSLRLQYGKDLANYNQERAGYTSNFPGLAGAKDQVRREAVSLGVATAQVTKNPDQSASYVAAELDKNKAEATYAGDRAQLASIDREISDMTAHLATSRTSNVSLSALLRDRDAGNQAYAQLSDRLALAIADRSQAASVNAIVVLDEAATASPTLISQPAVIFAAIAIAFTWLAISLALLVDQSDGRLRSRTTIEELYGSPVLTNVV